MISYSTLRIRTEVKNRIKKLGHFGETYSDVIQKALNALEREQKK